MSALAMAGSENCLPIGTRLTDFEITGILGEGGFGIVYIAFDHSLQRTVAIKEYMPGVLAARAPDHSIRVRADRHQETFNVGLKSFINEARFLAQFDHPSLVKVYRFWEQNHTAYTAMQYYDGRTIKDIVTSTPELITEEWCRKILKQILDALEMLYTMRILHRDVSPDNIIVQENGDAVLLDFGSARQIIGDRTRGLTVILKPGYAPVEQYAGDASLDQGAYTDIYALSAVIYFAIMKEPPATSIARMVKDPIAPLAERGVEGYSREFLAALDKGLMVMAHERPQTIDAFRELLGIASSGTPRARPNGDTQRFSTLRKLPEPGTPITGERPAVPPGSPPPPPHSGPPIPKPAPRPGQKTAQKPGSKRPAAPAAKAQSSAPRWAARAALVVAVLAIAGFGAKWLLDTPTEIMMPAAQVDPSPALPDAAAALPVPAASAAVVAASVMPPPEAALDPNPPVTPAAVVATGPAPDPAVALDDKPAVADTASYRLGVKPWGTVYIDGKEKGVTPPLKRLVLPAGKHKVRIVNPSFPDYLVEVNLAKGKSGSIEYDFAAHSK
jgi:serine/threonine protein kinase